MNDARTLLLSAPFLLFALTACSSVSSSSIATGPARGQAVSAAEVEIAATWVPEGAAQVAIIETHGNFNEGLEELMLGFRGEVAAAGGTFGKVDTMRTRFEIVQQTQMQTYNCGTSSNPQTCTRQVTNNVEVGTTTIMGRAFLTERL